VLAVVAVGSISQVGAKLRAAARKKYQTTKAGPRKPSPAEVRRERSSYAGLPQGVTTDNVKAVQWLSKTFVPLPKRHCSKGKFSEVKFDHQSTGTRRCDHCGERVAFLAASNSISCIAAPESKTTKLFRLMTSPKENSLDTSTAGVRPEDITNPYLLFAFLGQL
jgi:hypothetical protein